MEPENGSRSPEGLTIIIDDDLGVHSQELLIPEHILDSPDES